MNNLDQARQLVAGLATEDKYWKPGDEDLICVESTDKPEHFVFSVAGTFHTDNGCVLFRGGQPDAYFHDEETGEPCPVCGWKPEEDEDEDW